MNPNIKNNARLTDYNTFRIEAKAKSYVAIENELQLPPLYSLGKFNQNYFVLGGGSNVLFTKDYEGLVVHMRNKGIQHFIENSYAYVTAAAGEIWNDLVWYCIQHDFPGIENMALIPGTVGASPIQNIGAYGTELMDVFYSCRAFDTKTGKFSTFNNQDCKFTYRDSRFKTEDKGRYIIVSVTLRLHIHGKINTKYGSINEELASRNIHKPTIKDVADVVSHIRVEKLPDPKTIGNAGSFFKNPIVEKAKQESLSVTFPEMVHYAMDEQHSKIAAGWLIEYCGWKGKQINNVLIWPKQALVITNTGKATGKEIYDVSDKIINEVKNRFDIILEREVNIL